MTNPNCGMCGHLNVRGFCNLTACPYPVTKTEVVNVKKPPTNADRIRAMSDEELSIWLAGKTDCAGCPKCGEECDAWTCDEAWLNWLKEEQNNE